MSSGIFVLQKDGTLVEMNQQEFDSEDVLQILLERYPNLLSGSLIDEINPRKWILISREFSIPDQEASEGRWSIDHLFLDQDGVPTLVEVKRSADTRIRREVVGQMLEYAANAVSYWNIDNIKLQYENRCQEQGQDPEQTWVEQFRLDEGYEEYWNKVNTNLELGKIRMLFIADEIPLELKQIVEFLNEQMDPAEVLALEIKQYVGEDQKTLIPRVFGQSSKTQIKKSGVKQWDEPSLLKEIGKREGNESVDIVKTILSWAKKSNLYLWWGKGIRSGSCFPMFKFKDKLYWLFAIWTYGKIEFQFQHMKKIPIYDKIEKRYELLEELNKIQGISISKEDIERRPSIPLNVLSNKSALNKFLSIWDNVIKEYSDYFAHDLK
jgi:hypothetical protein